MTTNQHEARENHGTCDMTSLERMIARAEANMTANRAKATK